MTLMLHAKQHTCLALFVLCCLMATAEANAQNKHAVQVQSISDLDRKTYEVTSY